jgi:phosphoadenosine phosphosulfate reductase
MLGSAEVHEKAAALRGTPPEEVLRWALETFPRRTALTVSFGGPGVVLAHMLSRIDKTVPIYFLDTGFHFSQTLEFKARFTAQYGLNVVDLKPATEPGPLYQTDPDRCCWIRKVEPMQRTLPEFDAWVSALRADQAKTRSGIEVLEYHDAAGHAVVKVYPLATWSRDTVWQYIREHQIPYHPLHDSGFRSIGCWPCTRATRPGEDERAGRWSGMGKTECGLHTFTVKQ